MNAEDFIGAAENRIAFVIAVTADYGAVYELRDVILVIDGKWYKLSGIHRVEEL